MCYFCFPFFIYKYIYILYCLINHSQKVFQTAYNAYKVENVKYFYFHHVHTFPTIFLRETSAGAVQEHFVRDHG